MEKKILKLKKALPMCAVCLIAGVAAAFFFRSPGDTNSGLEIDNNAVIGILPGIDIEQRQAELQQQLDEAMIAFSINASPVFASGSSEGNLMLENPEHNAKLLVVSIYLDGTGELIYQSKALPTGSYIENVRLDKVLEPGEYTATAYFQAYRKSDHSYIGQAGAAITITVLS